MYRRENIPRGKFSPFLFYDMGIESSFFDG